MEKQQKINPGIIGVVLLVIIGIVVVVLVTRRSAPVETTDTLRENQIELIAEPVSEPAAEATPSPEVAAPTPLSPDSSLVAAAPTPRPTPFDPENQPRDTHLLDFRNRTALPDGYTLDGIRLTDNGFELPPPEPGKEDLPRFGTLESPPYELDFPSNAVSPLWLEELPEGTSLFVEVGVSPDGENWGLWHPIEPDDDAGPIGEYLPDGSPNPNYNHTAGGLLFWGNRQWQYYRFRVTLSSEVQDSPRFSTFHLYYQDSTLGEGHIAELQGDEMQSE